MTGVQRCRDLIVRLDGRAVLTDRPRPVRPHDRVIGDNGSGKSTSRASSRVSFGETPGTSTSWAWTPNGKPPSSGVVSPWCSATPTRRSSLPVVGDDVGFSLRAERLPKAERAERVARAPSRDSELTDLAERPAHDLSGGQKQLLALCGAFVREPDLVVADEPTAYLDARNARRGRGSPPRRHRPRAPPW